MTGAAAGQPAPWYQHGWVWALIAIPASSIAVGIVMILAALSSPGDLVRDDYYKAGLAINRDLSAARQAEALGLEVKLADRGPAGLLLTIEAGADAIIDDPDAELAVLLQHPTLEARDIELRMVPVAVGRWAVSLQRFDGVRSLRVSHPTAGWLVQTDLRAPAVGDTGS